MDQQALSGKTVIITGGAGDVGCRIADLFASHGAQLMLVDRDETALQATIELLPGDRTDYCVADVTREDDSRRYVTATLERFGSVDVLLANAGVEGSVAPISEYDTNTFAQVMAVNVHGPFLGIKHCFEAMASSGGGSIIITSSIAGVSGAPGLSAYCASKHAVIGLMRSAAAEGAAHNIRVNTVNPAPVEGRMIRSLEEGNSPEDPDAVREMMQARIPLQRYAVPEDVAALMLFLSSDASSYLTGGVYMVDGGMTAV